MNDIMNRLGLAVLWADRLMSKPEPQEARDVVLAHLVHVVAARVGSAEKPSPAADEHDAFPTVQEILDAWIDAHAATVLHRATAALDIVRDRVMPELAARDKRIAELEKQMEDTNAIHRRLDDLGIATARATMRGEAKALSLRERVAELAERYRDRTGEFVALETQLGQALEERDSARGEAASRKAHQDELEKRLAGATATLTVDGKTPGQVFGDAFRNGFGRRVVQNPDSELVRIHGELRRDYMREQELDWANAMEIGAQAVLRAFGNPSPGQTPQTNAPPVAAGACRIEDGALAIVDNEIAKLEAKPAQSPLDLRCGHRHDSGLVCDRRSGHESYSKAHSDWKRKSEFHWYESDGQLLGGGAPFGLTAFPWKPGQYANETKPAPTPDHVHEPGSCSFCDKRPPDTSTESGLPDAVLWAMGAPTTQARAVEMVGAVRDLARRTHGALAERAEPSPK